MAAAQGQHAQGVDGGNGQHSSDMDRQALAFVQRYRPAIDWAMHQWHVPLADRPDLLQDITIRVLQRFRRLGPLGQGSHLGYAVATARSVINNYHRSRTASASAAYDAQAAELVRCTQLLPDEQAMRNDGHARLRYAVASLSPLRRYLVQQVMAGKSLVELAEELGYGHSALKVAHHRAVKELRKRLVRP